jgi:hypothetical protein
MNKKFDVNGAFKNIKFDPEKKVTNFDRDFNIDELFKNIKFDPEKKVSNFDREFNIDKLFDVTKKIISPAARIKETRRVFKSLSKKSSQESHSQPNWLKRMTILSSIIIPTFGAVGYKAVEYLGNLDNVNPSTKVKTVFGENGTPFVSATRLKESDPESKIKVESKPLPENLPHTNQDFVRKVPGTRQQLLINNHGTIEKLFVSKASGNKGKYIDDKGVEYILGKNKDGSYLILNEQKMGSGNESNFFSISKNQIIIPSPDANIHVAIKNLQTQGYRVDAILGTGAIRNATNLEIDAHKNGVNPFVSESLIHPGKYFTVAGETFFRNSNGTMVETNNLQIHNPMRKTGYYTTNKGVFFLDLEGKDDLEIQKTLSQLKNDKNVIGYTLAGWPLRKNGRIENINTTIGQSRTAMIFDSKNKFLATVVTPPIGFMDILTVVESQYGKNCKILALDGDFYSGVKYFNNENSFNKDEMYLTHSANLLVTKIDNPKLNNFSEDRLSRTIGVAKTHKRQDLGKDLVEGVKYDPIGSLRKLHYRFFGGNRN